MPTINYKGRSVDAVPVKYKSVREDWNEYDLEDGSTIRLKAIVSDIVRVPDEYDPENNPVYVVKSTNMVVVSSPDNLKKVD